MNTLKPLLICAVLAGIGYGVYVRINSGSDTPPPGAPHEVSPPPEVQLGEAVAPGEASAWPAGAGGGTAPAFAPPAGAPATPNAGGQAPPFAPGPAPNASVEGGQAPPFDPQTAAPPVDGQLAPPAGVADVGVPGAAPPTDGASLTAPAGADRYAAPDAAPQTQTIPEAQVPDRYRTDNTATPDAQMPAGAPADQAVPTGTFVEAMDAAKRDLEAGQMANALAKLSVWYDDPRLSPGEQQQLNQLLDQVAGTVVYSTQHLLEPPCEVQPGERLEDIAQRYNVPWQLLAKINGIEDPANLRAGERLKVVRGPFNAVVNLQKRELTLTLPNGVYAGRFPIGLGQDQPPREGSYAVSDKVVDPVYHGRQRVAGAGDAANPLGNRWIGLGTDLGIHGTDRAENIGRTVLPGSISLSPRDVEDVFDILATGSRVTIRR
ncbi:MAG: LysM peptidoglycan-binding domain-containing protein [Pirellulales bacterium]